MNEFVWLLIISLAAMIGGAAIGAWLRAPPPGTSSERSGRQCHQVRRWIDLHAGGSHLGLLISTAKISWRFNRVSDKPDIVGSGLG